jgi:hypothetical protein
VGAFWVCPEHGQIADEPESHPLRIFLSYGHDANEELVRRIKADLEVRGHDVWFDQDEIKGGQDWRRSITDGIVASDRVLSFLSKHSTRDPGVCLDEIAIAIGAKGGNIQTVLVEGEQEVHPPASLSHIQWLDMHDWKERRAAGDLVWDEWYQAKLSEIVAVVESDESRRFAGEIEALERILAPISSDSRIAQLLKKGFVGRTWLLDLVEEWRVLKDRSSRLFCILGAPGVGKSAFAAHLAHYGRDKVVAVQFCEYEKPDHRDPGRIVKTLAFQLATRLPDYRKLLLALPEIKRLEGKSAPELFDYLLTEPLHHVIEGGRERYLIVIDALDEAGKGGGNVFVDMLAANAQRLPAWIGILATSRPESGVVGPLQGLGPIMLDTATESNRNDIRDFLRRELTMKLEGRPDADHLLELIMSKSEGVFLFAVRFCEDVLIGNLSLDEPGEFPVGLGGVYFQYLQRQFPDIEEYRRSIRPTLRAILAAREPLPIVVLQRLFDWDDETTRDIIRQLGSLFVAVVERGRSHAVSVERIRPHHKSLADFLLDHAKSAPYFVSEPEGHRLLAERGLWEFDHSGAISTYYADHLVAHLAGSGDQANLNRLLGDAAFLAQISGPSARFDIAEAAVGAPLTDQTTSILRVPERYLEMCRELQAAEHIGLKEGLLPPVEAIDSCTRPGPGGYRWDTAAYLRCIMDLLVWYSRSLDIAARFTADGLWDTARLASVLESSESLDSMTHQIWERDYPTRSGAIANMSDAAQRSRSACAELIDLKTLISETEPRSHRFLKINSRNMDARHDLGALRNAMEVRPRWHPRPAVHYKTLGPQEDYAEVWRFHCCGARVVVGDGQPSQYVLGGCEEAPITDRSAD